MARAPALGAGGRGFKSHLPDFFLNLVGLEADPSGIASSEGGRFQRRPDECHAGGGKIPTSLLIFSDKEKINRCREGRREPIR